MIYEQVDHAQQRRLPVSAGAASIAAHLLIVLFFVVASAIPRSAPEQKAVDVKFVGPGTTGGPPPPPPPPPGRKQRRRTTQPTKVTKIEIPKEPVIQRKEPEEKEPPKDGDDGVQGGVEGGVKGGVVGGVLGGTVGGTGGGGTAVPPPEKPKAKNVPPFVIARDAIRAPTPRMNEVFKQSHRGETLTGMYRVCVGQDGHVYDVIPVKTVAGADEEIIGTIKDEWLYKEQPQPVCFVYAFNISIVQ